MRELFVHFSDEKRVEDCEMHCGDEDATLDVVLHHHQCGCVLGLQVFALKTFSVAWVMASQ